MRLLKTWKSICHRVQMKTYLCHYINFSSNISVNIIQSNNEDRPTFYSFKIVGDNINMNVTPRYLRPNMKVNTSLLP